MIGVPRIPILHLMTRGLEKLSNSFNVTQPVKYRVGLTWEQVILTWLYCNCMFACVFFLSPPPKTAGSLRAGDCDFFMFISWGYGPIGNKCWMQKNAWINLQNFTCGLSSHRGIILKLWYLGKHRFNFKNIPKINTLQFLVYCTYSSINHYNY